MKHRILIRTTRRPRMTRFAPRLEMLEDRTAPAVCEWVGGTSQLWSDKTNWLNNTMPGKSDTADFNNQFVQGTACELDLTGNTTIAALTSSGYLGILIIDSSRTLTITPGPSGPGTVWTNGSIIFAATSSTIYFNGTTTAPAFLFQGGGIGSTAQGGQQGKITVASYTTVRFQQNFGFFGGNISVGYQSSLYFSSNLSGNVTDNLNASITVSGKLLFQEGSGSEARGGIVYPASGKGGEIYLAGSGSSSGAMIDVSNANTGGYTRCDMPVVPGPSPNNYGTVQMEDSSRLHVHGYDLVTSHSVELGPNMALKLGNSSSLNCDDIFFANGGSTIVPIVPSNFSSATVISAAKLLLYGTVDLSGNQMGALLLNGTTTAQSATFQLKVDVGGAEGISSKISMQNNTRFTLTGATTLSVRDFGIPPVGVHIGVVAGAAGTLSGTFESVTGYGDWTRWDDGDDGQNIYVVRPSTPSAATTLDAALGWPATPFVELAAVTVARVGDASDQTADSARVGSEAQGTWEGDTVLPVSAYPVAEHTRLDKDESYMDTISRVMQALESGSEDADEAR